MSQARQALAKVLAVLVMPLSLVPIYLALPRLRGSAEPPQPVYRGALAAPTVHPTKAEIRAWQGFPAYRHAVPVLVYHGINGRNDGYSVSRRDFAKQMQMLARARFHTIGIAQYVRFLRGERVRLPSRPVLITFDDGRLDSYQGADRVLARHRFRATIFVIAGEVEKQNPFYLSWGELHRMSRSDRWDVQTHAGLGHHAVRYDASGRRGPFYAYRRYVPGEGRESLAGWRKRAFADVATGQSLMEKRLPDYKPHAFAVPFGNLGQNGTNDPRIPRLFGRFLRERFAAVMLVQPAAFTTEQTDRGRIGRYEAHTHTTPGRLFTWLRKNLPPDPSAAPASTPAFAPATPATGAAAVTPSPPAPESTYAPSATASPVPAGTPIYSDRAGGGQ